MAKDYQPESVTPLYGGEVDLEFYERLGRRTHVYQIGGVDVPNVTTILGVLDKPALIGWAVNEMEAYLLRECKPGTVIDEVTWPITLASAKGARYVKSDTGKTIGALAHDWIEQYVKFLLRAGDMPGVPINDQLRAAIDSFLLWEKSHEIVWLVSERKSYSRSLNYCGTFNFLARIDGVLTLGDFKTTNVNKTTKSGIYPEHWLQTAAYQFAVEEENGYIDGHKTHVDGLPYQPIQQRMIVRLGKDPRADGSIEFEVKTSREFERDFNGFKGALAVFQAMAPITAGDGIATVGLDAELLKLAGKAA